MAKILNTLGSKDAVQKLGDLMSTGLATWLTQMTPSDLWQTCVTCAHSSKTGPAYCSKFKMVPPVVVIAGNRTCEGYRNAEEIPF